MYRYVRVYADMAPVVPMVPMAFLISARPIGVTTPHGTQMVQPKKF